MKFYPKDIKKVHEKEEEFKPKSEPSRKTLEHEFKSLSEKTWEVLFEMRKISMETSDRMEIEDRMDDIVRKSKNEVYTSRAGSRVYFLDEHLDFISVCLVTPTPEEDQKHFNDPFDEIYEQVSYFKAMFGLP